MPSTILGVADAAGICRAAARALECVGVTGGESVLVVYNVAQKAIAEALGRVARARADAVSLLPFETLTRHGEEPPVRVAEAMQLAAAVLAPTTYSLSHTQARIDATHAGARVATMPTITVEVFARALFVDYAELKRVGDALVARLDPATSCRIRSSAGTDVELRLAGRRARNDDGDLRGRGAFGNLPAGEAYIAPHEHGAEGIIVFDGSLAGYGLLEEPLRVTVNAGRLVAAEGAAAAWLLETLDAGGETGRTIAELGIGTNPAARITGNILEDEKVAGTVHLAFGTSVGIGGENVSTVHIDGVVRAATVEVDGREIMRDGERVVVPA